MAGVGDLIGQSVWDSTGVWVGQVVDVRVVKSRGTGFGVHEEFEVRGLIVSANRAPILLGVARDPGGRMSWFVHLLQRLLYAGSTYVPWEAVASTGGGEVMLSTRRGTLQRV
ncbi:hypothetical protein SAMN05421505_105144 [Sinosporangium album]|uniref:PRC-barrel domain-containing protein n=1 Tax=Sinosporangium album TaxID=504805 RepID=A0A1G7V7F5_9ACTN|nr:hypothetical protein [Sinosporangium album]SDG55518.1 hypothetical protein SAMN05421505_105144 [Sinosporangium album]